MLPASNQGLGDNMGFPDVCNTPVGTATSPLPYANDGTNAAAMPMLPTILLSLCPGHNQNAKPLATNGDEAGCAHSSFIMSGGNNLGNIRILLSGGPAETQANPSQGNNYNCSTGAKLVPSLTNILMGYAPPAGADALAELLDRPAGSGLTLDGRSVLQVRRGGPAARAGVRRGDALVACAVDGDDVALAGQVARWRVVRAGRTLELAGPSRWATGPVAARLGPDGLGVVAVRRCSVGAPAAAAAALVALRRAGAWRLVLDLSGNPGGLLDAGAALAGLFLPAGATALAADVATDRTARWVTTTDGLAADLPLEVRVDGGTASAAEALAAALQDAGHALVGARTLGKLHAAPIGGGPAIPMRRTTGARLDALVPDRHGRRGGLA